MILGVGVLAVVLVIVLIVMRPGAGGAAPAPPASSPAAAPAATPSEASTIAPADPVPDPAPTTTGPAGECIEGALKVEAFTDKAAYASTEQPLLSLALTNVGAVPCIASAGSDVQEYVVTSGADRIWSSRDCQQNAVAQQVELEPGQTVSTTPFAWDRTRSSADTCDVDRLPVVANGSSYHLDASVGDVTSTGSRQFMLY